MPLYGPMGMTHLPITLTPGNGWACVLELDDDGRPYHLPMSESDVRELLEMLEEALR